MMEACFGGIGEEKKPEKRMGLAMQQLDVEQRHALRLLLIYQDAEALTAHLARCLALEGAEHGIRVNVVNPDAVIRGSRIWDSSWRRERADAYGVDAGEELEEHYRKRSMLKQNVLPEDIAEAVWYFAAPVSAKSTGNIVNVDAGNAQAFTR
jgi:NAD(P)-dependent dehydrogenase (short-subunit alcohol dehydrogenase family)